MVTAAERLKCCTVALLKQTQKFKHYSSCRLMMCYKQWHIATNVYPYSKQSFIKTYDFLPVYSALQVKTMDFRSLCWWLSPTVVNTCVLQGSIHPVPYGESPAHSVAAPYISQLSFVQISCCLSICDESRKVKGLISISTKCKAWGCSKQARRVSSKLQSTRDLGLGWSAANAKKTN